MDVRAIYGPSDPSLLRLQDHHRSEIIYNDPSKTDSFLRTRGSEQNIWGLASDRIVLHPRVLQKLETMGFYGVYSCGPQKVDGHLITALVERWRSETHTFHLPVGEATVTLYDVGVLWRLPVDGKAVTCTAFNMDKQAWSSYCAVLTGFVPDDSDVDGNCKLKVKSLGDWLLHNPVTDYSTEEEVEQQARGYGLLLIGCVMCPDMSGSRVNMNYLQFLEEIDQVRSYSWGSAVLAYLYRELCTASHGWSTNIGGAVRLLQVWAWMHILPFQPRMIQEKIDMVPICDQNGNVLLPSPPHAARWNAKFSYTRTIHSCVRTMREVLDNLNPSQFRWVPYDSTGNECPEVHDLPYECVPMACTSTCPLIFYNIVEMFYPGRVMRQLGMIQGIPDGPHESHAVMHEQRDLRGRRDMNWAATHHRWVNMWNTRDHTLVGGMRTSIPTVSDGYEEWYDRITRRFISPSTRRVTQGMQMGDGVAWRYVQDTSDDIVAACGTIPDDVGISQRAERMRRVSRARPEGLSQTQPQPRRRDMPSSSQYIPVTGDISDTTFFDGLSQYDESAQRARGSPSIEQPHFSLSSPPSTVHTGDIGPSSSQQQNEEEHPSRRYPARQTEPRSSGGFLWGWPRRR